MMTSKAIADDDGGIILRVKEGDENAYSEFYQRYYSRVFDLAIVIVKNEDWAFDIVQETFLKIWSNREKLQEGSDVWYYIRVIVRNECINKLREIQKDQALREKLSAAVEERSSIYNDPLVDKALSDRYERAKQKLTAQQFAVFTMCREDGLEYQEVADRLNISKNTVKNHMVASIRFLKHFHRKDILYFLFILLRI